jgi:hypothetical protein
MPRRAAIVTQADVARTLRAVMAVGLHVVRIVTRADGVSIETVETVVTDSDEPSVEEKRVPVL